MKLPDRLGSRAKALWDGVLSEAELDSAGLTLLEDAARTVDIIDRLSGAINSKDHAILRLSDDLKRVVKGEDEWLEIHVVVNPLYGALAQQRQLLKTLLAQLKLGNIKPKSAESQVKSLFEQLEEEFRT